MPSAAVRRPGLPALALASLTGLALVAGGCGGELGRDLVEALASPPVQATAEPEPEPAPVELFLTWLEPTEGDVTGFTEVQLHGSGLAEVAAVYFGPTEALETLAINDGLVVALTPPRPHGLVDVSVVTTDGRTATLESAFRFEQRVQVVEVSPAQGHVLGGDALTVTGLGFLPDSVVLVGERRALAVQVVDANTLVAIAPAAAEAGPADVHVANPAGVGRLADGFHYVEAPRIDMVTPPAGPLDAETEVEVRGAGFVAPLAVTVGASDALEAEITSPSVLRVRIPPSEVAGSADVAVATPWGTAVAADAFTWLPDTPPVGVELLALHPVWGSTSGGALVTLTVRGLESAATTEVHFGGAPATVVALDPETSRLVVSAPPADAAGLVAVEVSGPAGAAAREDAFQYRVVPELHEVTPNFGPTAGGERITVTGRGFTPGTAVRLGALPASGVTFIDAETLEATTPEGSPGLASVTVLGDGHVDTLVAGYVYQAPLAAWVAEPATGSVAGGTLVRVLGAGFEGGATVTFAGAAASDVRVLSPTLLEARTPPGMVGPALVEVTLPGGDRAEQAAGFTYFDPASAPGTWGGPVERNVNITVFDRWRRERIAGAVVMLGLDPLTEHRGFTDEAGQITFGGHDLAGEQIVTVTADGFGTTSVAGFDATNITVPVDPIIPCEDVPDLVPCDPPPSQSGGFEGQVQQPFKGVKIPFGSCEDELNKPGQLCLGCGGDLECGDGLACSEIPGQGAFCTQPCAGSDECPTGYLCLPLPEQASMQCVPSAGELRTYCDITNPSLGDQDAIPWPGQLVGEDGIVDFPTRLGDYAIFCWSGLYKDGRFTPQMLGVARHLGAFEDGEQVDATVEMNHPVDQRVTIALDRPRIAPTEEQERVQVRMVLDLGADGVLEFPTLLARGREPLEATVLDGLTGDLFDASWTLVATVQSDFEPNAASTTWRDGIRDLRADAAFRDAGDGWQQEIASKATTRGIAATAAGTLWAVGDGGLIMQRAVDAGYWALNASKTKADLHAIATSEDGGAIAVGAGGVATHWGGSAWELAETGVEGTLEGVWMARADDAWAVVSSRVLRFDGGAWVQEAALDAPLHAIWGSGADDVWVAGEGGYVARYDGQTWSPVESPTEQTLRAVWGRAADDVYFVGDAGTVLTWDGAALSVVEAPTDRTLHALWGPDAEGAMIAVGARGTLLRHRDGAWLDESPFGYEATFLATGGAGDERWAMGSHELVLGPMMAIPENLSPAAGAPLGDSLSWTVEPFVTPHFNMTTFGSASGPCSVCGMQVMIPFTEWTGLNRGHIDGVVFPDLSALSGKPGFGPGAKSVEIVRVYLEDAFDFDATDGEAFYGGRWRSWAVNATSVVR